MSLPKETLVHLHVLRNPWNLGEERVREARQWASDEIERLARELSEARAERDELVGEVERLRPALQRLVDLRDEAELTEPLVENTNIAAIARWRDRWIGAYTNARAALKPAKPDDGTAKPEGKQT